MTPGDTSSELLKTHTTLGSFHSRFLFRNLNFTLLHCQDAFPYPKSNRSKESARLPFLNNFNSYLVVPVDITVVGQDFHVAGNHKTAQSFHDEVCGRLTAVIKPDMLRVEVLRVIGGDKSAWAAVELLATATIRYGE